MTYGEQIRDFTPVDIVVSAFLNSLGNVGNAGEPEIQNIGTGISQSLRSFALYWWNEWSAKGKLRFGEINYRDGEIMHYVPEL
jgi:nucleoside-diphosphate-sugar epimerase